ncbi:hypothetical protein C7460_103199 [Marinoscillum furvescens DSM 4134]|uniref:DUF6089 domain-containing protein n=2 Tax=Marinoscillum furvescens TaxID=1026 RepID=A0A3D9L9E7_MARFU|nr:hypothetical protein C7460_103199 [Marinoscillum furvescens DSM 4134]
MEFGGGIGGMHYTGDLNAYPRLEKTRLSGNLVYRLNLSEIVSFKFGLTAGNIVGNDENPRDALAEERQHSFNHRIIEFSSTFEYHFLSYRSDKNRSKWSPFIFLGFGLTQIGNTSPTYEDYSKIQPVIPMGGGVKYELTKRLTLTGEMGARKTFFDYLDGVSDGDQRIKNFRYGNPNDKDWYFYTGVSLTYVLYKIPCPFPYVPNRSILNRIRSY